PEGVTQAITNRQQGRAAFSSAGRSPDSDAVSDVLPGRAPGPALAFSVNLGKVGSRPVSRYLMIAYDDLYSIEYFDRRERAWWRRNGADAADLLRMGWRDHDVLLEKSKRFDDQFMADLREAGGEK